MKKNEYEKLGLSPPETYGSYPEERRAHHEHLVASAEDHLVEKHPLVQAEAAKVVHRWRNDELTLQETLVAFGDLWREAERNQPVELAARIVLRRHTGEVAFHVVKAVVDSWRAGDLAADDAIAQLADIDARLQRNAESVALVADLTAMHMTLIEKVGVSPELDRRPELVEHKRAVRAALMDFIAAVEA